MKKFWLLSLVLALVMLFSSCGIIFDAIEGAGGNDDEQEKTWYSRSEETEEEIDAEEVDAEDKGSVDVSVDDSSVPVYSEDDSAGTVPVESVPFETETEPVETTEAPIACLEVPPIAESLIAVEPFAKIESYSVSVDFIVETGNISGKGSSQSFSFVAPQTGVYHCWVDMMSGLDVTMEVYDSKNVRVKYDSNLSGGDGLTCDLVKDESYTVTVKYYNGTGDYTLTIGQQKADVDITGTTYIADAIEFNNQENYYLFTPAVSGNHRFYLSDINSDCKVSIYIYDSQGYRLQYDTNESRGEGINEVLTAGETYRIGVVEYSGFGGYALNVGIQKPTVSLEGYNTVTDSIQFANQENYYSFTPVISGVHRFEITKIDSGNSVSLYAYDDEGYRLTYDTSVRVGEGLSLELEAGKNYTLAVEEYEGFVPYTFIVASPKETNDITGIDTVYDSIQFTDQENSYLFTPSVSGEYTFEVMNTQSGFSVSVYIYDNAGYRLKYSSGMDAGDYIYETLTAGVQYTVVVCEYSGFGDYALAIR